ncbi:MAG TPA: DNA-processing protein DprA [Candidatus Polarisedimenticolaceae bacterium]|nr:DNA-processing protein DprA [Candidatus Polarisedimenticolaceae bacterium]
MEKRPKLLDEIANEWEAAVRANVSILSRDDPDYPPLLAELPDAPLVLYVRGSLPAARVRVAMVGSRRSTFYGKFAAGRLAAGLAAVGVEIVSGGARGIDTLSHRGALDAGGTTVAVMGNGLGRVYPPENGSLFEKIAENGALVSEFPMEMASHPENFPQRNRLIAGLSAATVIVEAAGRSGSLITARFALEQGREVMAVPGRIDSEQSTGCHRLIQAGAKLVQSPEEILEELSPMYRNVLPQSEAAQVDDTPLTPDELAVLGLFAGHDEVHVDILADAAPFGIARLQAALFGLAVRRRIDPLQGGYYVARPRVPGHGPQER